MKRPSKTSFHAVGGVALERLHVVDDFEQVAALGAAVDDLVERILAVAAGDTTEVGAVRNHRRKIALARGGMGARRKTESDGSGLGLNPATAKVDLAGQGRADGSARARSRATWRSTVRGRTEGRTGACPSDRQAGAALDAIVGVDTSAAWLRGSGSCADGPLGAVVARLVRRTSRLFERLARDAGLTKGQTSRVAKAVHFDAARLRPRTGAGLSADRTNAMAGIGRIEVHLETSQLVAAIVAGGGGSTGFSFGLAALAPTVQVQLTSHFEKPRISGHRNSRSS